MKNLGELYTLGIWSVKPGNERAFIDAWQSFADWTCKHQSGAVHAVLLQDTEQPQRFISYGPWNDEKSIKEWRQRTEFQEFLKRARALCDNIEPLMMQSVAHVASH